VGRGREGGYLDWKTILVDWYKVDQVYPAVFGM
jgi:hypothetical protein